MKNKKINEISELILELISRREITYHELQMILDKVSCDARERLTFAPLNKQIEKQPTQEKNQETVVLNSLRKFYELGPLINGDKALTIKKFDNNR